MNIYLWLKSDVYGWFISGTYTDQMMCDIDEAFLTELGMTVQCLVQRIAP